MSKAEERALELYPPIQYDRNNEVVRNGYDNQTRKIFIKGYQQAEKDVELTWEDMRLIDKISSKLLLLKGDLDDKGFFQEVLKRFKDYRERKEK